MFERFTDKARHSLTLAQAEARGMGHDFLGTEHLLLGLLQSDGLAAHVLAAEGFTTDGVREQIKVIIGPGPAGQAATVDDAEALKTIGIDLDEVRAAVEESFGEGALDRAQPKRGGRRLGAPPFVPRAKKVLELALREALSLQHSYIGTEHILLGILREGEGVAAQILSESIDLGVLRTKVIDELKRLRPGA